MGETITIRAGPILDRNGHPVPDGTRVNLQFFYRAAAVYLPNQEVGTRNGTAETTVFLERPGQLEGRPRGLYTGALGWIAPGGDLRLSVAIRTLELAADRSGIMGVGSGVVADSSPPAEWRECALKAAFLADLDPGGTAQLGNTLGGAHSGSPLSSGRKAAASCSAPLPRNSSRARSRAVRKQRAS